MDCRNPSLGLVTKARACKVAGQEGTLGGTLHAPGVPKSVREWTFTLSSELPMDSQIFRAQLQGQNPSAWRFFYIIGKLSKRKFIEWARIAHLDIWNTSYDQKKSRESNWQFDSWPLKVGNRLDFLACRQRATYYQKALDKSYNFTSNFIAIRGLHAKLCDPKVARVPTVGIWMWPSWRGAENTIRGKVVASPKSRPWWVLWVRVCPWLVLAPKGLQLCTNRLVLVLCRSVWVIEAC
jgi:hypothetical protein